MGDLTGKRIDLTYDGLIKTSDEGPVGQNLVTLQDGLGNNLPIQVSGTDVNFTGNVTGDNDTTYDLSAGENLPDALITLTGSDGSTDTITLQAGAGIVFGVTGNTIDVSATGGGGGATYTVNVIQNGLNVDLQLLADAVVVDTITLQAGGNVTLTQQGQAVVFSATDTNTLYDLGSVQNGSDVDLKLASNPIGSTDTVTLVAGTNITLTDNGSNEVTIDAAGGGGGVVEFSSAYRNNIYSGTMGGYPVGTYAKHMQPVVGRPFMFTSVDQSDNSTLFVRCYGEAGMVMSTIVVPLFAGAACDATVSIYAADATTGLPGAQVYQETFIEATGLEGFYQFNLSIPQAMLNPKSWWVGVRTDNERKLAMISGDNVISTFSTNGAWGGAIQGLLAVNTLFYNTFPVATVIPTAWNWSHRDELTMYFWK